METISLDMLLAASKAGGPNALSDVTRLVPAGGEQALVAPAKYTVGNRATYVFDRRFVEGRPVNTVLLDSRTSNSNRLEAALARGIAEGQSVLTAMPHMQVVYDTENGKIVEADYQLPHRAFDAHFRLGADSATGEPFISNERYVAARNATPDNAWDLFSLSPVTVLFGGWDSTRKSHQARFASCVTGEIVGVLADQDKPSEELVSHRSGGRIDPVGSGIYFSEDDASKIAERIGQKLKKGKKNEKISGSTFVIGSIPPSASKEALDGISVRYAIRSRVLSFSALRMLSFGRGAKGDQAIRSLLAAIALSAMARADSDLYLRANAHLVESGAPVITLFKRFGEMVEIAPLDVGKADELLEEAYAYAERTAGIEWSGDVLEVKGAPAVIRGIDDAASGE